MAITYERVPKMPPPSVDLLGTIYRYAGSTNDSYTRGYYYQCDGINQTYSRHEGGGSFTHLTYDLNNPYISDMNFTLSVLSGNNLYTVDILDEDGNIYKSFGKTTDVISDVIPPGYTLHLGYTAYSGRYDLNYSWCEWKQVQVDEHNIQKYMSRENMIYFLSELVYRLNN